MPVSGKIILKIGGLNMKHKLYSESYDIPPGHNKRISKRYYRAGYTNSLHTKNLTFL